MKTFWRNTDPEYQFHNFYVKDKDGTQKDPAKTTSLYRPNNKYSSSSCCTKTEFNHLKK